MNVMKMTSSTKNMKTNKKGLQETKIPKTFHFTPKGSTCNILRYFFVVVVNKNHCKDLVVEAVADRWSLLIVLKKNEKLGYEIVIINCKRL